MPENLWSDEDAAELPDLEGLVYRSHLLGADRSVINIYGGNTSSKLTVTDHMGRPMRVIYVRGSTIWHGGWRGERAAAYAR